MTFFPGCPGVSPEADIIQSRHFASNSFALTRKLEMIILLGDGTYKEDREGVDVGKGRGIQGIFNDSHFALLQGDV